MTEQVPAVVADQEEGSNVVLIKPLDKHRPMYPVNLPAMNPVMLVNAIPPSFIHGTSFEEVLNYVVLTSEFSLLSTLLPMIKPMINPMMHPALAAVLIKHGEVLSEELRNTFSIIVPIDSLKNVNVSDIPHVEELHVEYERIIKDHLSGGNGMGGLLGNLIYSRVIHEDRLADVNVSLLVTRFLRQDLPQVFNQLDADEGHYAETQLKSIYASYKDKDAFAQDAITSAVNCLLIPLSEFMDVNAPCTDALDANIRNLVRNCNNKYFETLQ